MSTQTVSVGAQDAVEVEQVGGSLRVSGWDRQELQAGGEALRVERRAAAVAVSCGGDLVLSIPRDRRLLVTSVGGDILLENLAGGIELGFIGGDATLRSLSGPVRLVGMIGGGIHMENVADISMSSSKAGERFNVAEQVRRKVERAAGRAESKLRRAEHRGTFTLRMMKGQEAAASWNSDAKSPEPAEPASDEERMAILRMLHDRKITSEQAEKLLAALEGNA